MEITRRMHVVLADKLVSGITGSQFFVLRTIDNKGRLTVSDVAEKLGVSLSAITALVNRLVNAGLVVRSRDEQDRRLVWLEATDHGREILAVCLESRKKVANRYFGQLPVEDIEKLVEIYEKILTMMRAEEAGAEH